MTSVEPGLVDANVLVYATNADAANHDASRALLNNPRDPSVTLYVTSQILCEFYSIITNPRRVTTPSSPTEAVSIISTLLALPGIHLVPAPVRVVSILTELLRRHPVTGGEVFDLQIIATMLANNVGRIYTFNARDFEMFTELIVVVPSA
jgi:toxin-antitoxin system PIN domain toxin